MVARQRRQKKTMAFLSRRLAHPNEKILSNHAAERIWLSLVDNPAVPLEGSLIFHIAEALARRSQNRVLLLEMCGQDQATGPHFATHPGQMRPGSKMCEHDHSLLQPHHASPLTPDPPHYAP